MGEIGGGGVEFTDGPSEGSAARLADMALFAEPTSDTQHRFETLINTIRERLWTMHEDTRVVALKLDWSQTHHLEVEVKNGTVVGQNQRSTPSQASISFAAIRDGDRQEFDPYEQDLDARGSRAANVNEMVQAIATRLAGRGEQRHADWLRKAWSRAPVVNRDGNDFALGARYLDTLDLLAGSQPHPVALTQVFGLSIDNLVSSEHPQGVTRRIAIESQWLRHNKTALARLPASKVPVELGRLSVSTTSSSGRDVFQYNEVLGVDPDSGKSVRVPTIVVVHESNQELTDGVDNYRHGLVVNQLQNAGATELTELKLATFVAAVGPIVHRILEG